MPSHSNIPACRAILLGLILIAATGVNSSPVQAGQTAKAKGARPNVVLIMTDDQGYGDLSCHGNRELATPALDALHGQSLRLTNFHVDPTCSPTRSALLTGRYSSRTGVWHTIRGRSLMRKDEVTLPQVLSDAGYQTGIFGKWHLGDNYPLRAHERGFRQALVHGGGGVGQTPDFWGNDYFDDTYFHNGQPEPQQGYCTDVFFNAATRFIEGHREEPFFAYIVTNAPHFPYNVDEALARPFRDKGIPTPRAEFYGMITNIDDNVGRLLRKLDDWGLSENTLVIFMTDNGSAAGIDKAGGFNAGMRAQKGSEYDGGHRVPCFLRFPGRWAGGRDIPLLTAHIDLFPTVLELCGVSEPAGGRLDGRSLVPLLTSPSPENWPSRTLFVHSQRVEHPEKWRQSAVLTDRWRLINGRELYDMSTDPGQTSDVAAKNPDIVEKLRGTYDSWWNGISTRFNEVVRIELGSEKAPAETLTCHDWHSDVVPFDHNSVKRDLAANGFWEVDIVRAGAYRITLRPRPVGVSHPLKAGKARLRVNDIEVSRPVAAGADQVPLDINLPAGPARLQTWLDEDEGVSRGAFFVQVEKVP